jgi:hypothetical protein
MKPIDGQERMRHSILWIEPQQRYVFGALKSDDGVGCPLGRDKDLAGTFVGSAVFDFRGSMSDEDSDSTV